MRLGITVSDVLFFWELYGQTYPTLPYGGFNIARSRNIKMTTGPHGYETLSGFLPLGHPDSDVMFLADETPTVYLTAGSLEIWKGRLEDVAHTVDGIRWTAYGTFRYYSDKLISKIYSTQDISKLVQCTEDMQSAFLSASYKMDKNDRIYIALQKNAAYGNGIDVGAWVFYAPHLRDAVKRVEFDYDISLPTNWKGEVISYAEGFASANVEHTITTSGSGAATVTLTTARPLIVFRARNQTGGTSTYTGETGDSYAKWTNVRFKNADVASVVASDIVADVISEVEAINPGRINDSVGLIESTTPDLMEAAWLEQTADNVLRDLAATNDAAATPSQYEVGMWGDYLHFHSRGLKALTWYADVKGRKYERTLAGLVNSTYGVSRSAGGQRDLRSVAVENTYSQARYGLTREDYIRQNTTDPAIVADDADMLLENLSDPPYKITIDIETIRLPNGGGVVPPWMVRAGDILVVRNGVHIPGEAGQDFIEIRIARTELDVDNLILRVVPEAGSATIPMALTKRPHSFSIPGLGNAQMYQDPVRRAFR